MQHQPGEGLYGAQDIEPCVLEPWSARPGASHARLHETIKMRKVRFLRSLSLLGLILGHPLSFTTRTTSNLLVVRGPGASPLNIIVKN
jgi:hypothetical protein